MVVGMANKRKKTFYDWAAEYPPILCRLLARGNDGKPLTHEQICVSAKMTWLEVILVSEQTDWRRIDLPSMAAFTKACGVDFTDRMSMNRQVCYLRGKLFNGKRQSPKFKYLLLAPNCQSYFKPLYDRWVASLSAG